MTQPPGPPQGWWPQQSQGHPQHGSPPPPQAGQVSAFGGNFHSQYGGLGVFGDPPPPTPRRRRKWLVLGSVAVVVLAAGGVAAWLLGVFRGDVLNQDALQQGVARVLRGSYGEQDVRNVRCPANQEIVTGHTFECTVDISGRPKSVSIRVLNDQPQYEVGAPR
jgi:hypothetical protein